jgi:Tol biopolymer transport system component
MHTRTASVAVMSMLAIACSSRSPAPPTGPSPTRAPSPTAAPSATPGQTGDATPGGAVSASCAEIGIPGGRVAFTVGDGQANGIGVVDTDGSGFRVVVEPKSIAGQPHGGTEGPSWIGPGRILFDSNRNGGPDDWHLFTVDERGSEPVQITKGADGIEYNGDMSPDGSFIAYAKAVADPDAVFVDAGIFIAGADGRHERQLTQTPPGGVDEWPAISPDGKKVAFTRGHVGDAGGLFVVNLDGTGLTRIVPGAMEPLRPRWSADGRQIAFHSNGDRFLAESANVWVAGADGTGSRQLTDESGGDQGGQAFFPSWSPDGAYLVFVHHRRGSAANDLAVIPSVGGAPCILWYGTASAGAWESDWGPAAE